MPDRRRHTAPIAMLVAISFVLAPLMVLIGAGPTVAAVDRFPNLRMIPLADWQLQQQDGRRLLRFTTVMVNRGPGAFEVRGRRTSTADETMDIRQVIYDDAGGKRSLGTDAVARYAGDGHDHWHVQKIMTYELLAASDLSTVRRGAKTGFCFFDTTAWKLGLPYARQRPHYQEDWCGTQSSLTNRVGISVGWGDKYPWNFAFQWIDVTGLPGGRYVVRSTVDIQDWYRETNDLDNCTWATIHIPAPGTGTRVRVLDHGGGCGAEAITQVTTFPGARVYDPARQVHIQPGPRTAYAFNSVGTVVGVRRSAPEHALSAYAVRRATVPGRPGRWLYITSGRWAGYWLRDNATVDVVA